MSTMETASEKLDKLAKSVHDAQEASEQKNEEKFQKLAEESAKLLEEINTIKAEKEKQEEVIKGLEVQLANSPTNQTLKSVAMEEYREHLNEYMRSNPRSNPFKGMSQETLTSALKYAVDNSKAMPLYVTKGAKRYLQKDMVEGINPQGGYWILPEYSPTDITKIYETNPLRQLSTVQTTGTNAFKIIIDDQLSESGGWVGEVDSRTDTDTARIGEVTINIHEQYAEPKASHWMLDDVTFDLVSWMTGKTQQIFNLQENSAFLQGNGEKRPRGILNYPSWTTDPVEFGNDENYKREALETIASGQNGAVTANGYINTQLSLLEAYQPNANWLMTRQTWAQTLQLKDTQDRFLINLNNFLATGGEQILLGRPVRIAAPSQTVKQGSGSTVISGMPQPATNSKSVIYGDFREGYTIVDRLGFITITDIYTNKTYVKYYTRKRLGGALSSYQSLKVMQLSAYSA